MLDITIDGARGVLFNVTGGEELTLFEVNQAAAIIRETAHPDVNMIFGAVVDPNMGDEIRVTVIATGFERSGVPRRILRPERHAAPKTTPATFVHPARQEKREEEMVDSYVAPTPKPAVQQPQPKTYSDNDLDIPTFLRNRR